MEVTGHKKKPWIGIMGKPVDVYIPGIQMGDLGRGLFST